MVSDTTANFALDVQSVTKLKYSAARSPKQGLEQAAKQFEALFLQKMLSSMRDAMPKSDLLHSHQSDTYDSMMDQQWAQTLAKRGIGLADMMIRQMQPRAQAAGADASISGIATADPQPLAASQPLVARPAAASNVTAATPVEAAANTGTPLIDLPAYRDASATVFDHDIAPREAASRALLPDHVNAFLDRMGAAAKTASRETGIPQRLILAQAALETGWGRHEVKQADGSPSYNVFNIKATGWQGAAAEVATTEYRNGQARSERAAFRVYDSYEQSFADYARLLSESPRYAAVVDAPNAQAAARQLQACGYATDPDYADKLISIMKRLPAEPAAAAEAAPGPTPLFDTVDDTPLFADASSAIARQLQVAAAQGLEASARRAHGVTGAGGGQNATLGQLF